MANALIGLMALVLPLTPSASADVPPRSIGPVPPIVPMASTGNAIPVGPIGAWAPYGQPSESCAVSRNYGSIEKPSTLSVRLSLDQRTVMIGVVTQALSRPDQDGEGHLAMNPGSHVTDGHYYSFEVPEASQHVSILSVPHVVSNGLASARTVTIQVDSATTVSAAEMRAAIDEADRCQAKLYQSWGIDPKRFASVTSPPKPTVSPANWIYADDYPAAARHANLEGRVVMLLGVGKDGHIDACRVIESSGSTDLDETSCRIITERGSYTPATDARGKPVASWTTIPIRWSLQE